MADLPPVMPPTDPASLATQAVGGVGGGPAKLKRTAKQFEAMFMTEMVHFARPKPDSGGVFAPGDAEKTWGMFMDQALGTAAAGALGPNMTNAIEKSLALAQSSRKSGGEK